MSGMMRVYGRVYGLRVLCAVAVCLIAGAAAAAGKPVKGPGGHPDLSGFWMQSNKVAPDKTLMDRLPPNTAVLPDTGAVELPRGDWGGLKPRPKALATPRSRLNKSPAPRSPKPRQRNAKGPTLGPKAGKRCKRWFRACTLSTGNQASICWAKARNASTKPSRNALAHS